MGFSPLHIRSGYSFLKSGLTMDRLFQTIKKANYSSLALTDLGFLFGYPTFVKLANENHMHYGLGMEVQVTFGKLPTALSSYADQEFPLCLYAMDEEGYHSLMRISSHLSNHSSIPLDHEDIKGDHLVAVLSTDCSFFDIQALKDTLDSRPRMALLTLNQYFKHFYLGLAFYNMSELGTITLIRDFASFYGYNLVAFPLMAYAKKEDAITLRIVSSLEKDEKMDIQEESGPYYIKNYDELSKLYLEDELNKTIEIMNLLQVDFLKKRGQILLFHDEKPSAALLKEHAMNGLKKLNKWNAQYQQRLEYELSTIEQMGYSDYFLIVEDYVHYAKTHAIPVGPGRGSAAASLVAYSLNITTIDPLEYDLLFESFLNPARVTMPDIDIDFGDEKRDEVISYLKDKYGTSRVCNIVTFQTIGAKQSLRDIGRVFSFSSSDIDLLSKSIQSNNISLRDAYKKIPAFRQLVDSDTYYLSIIRLASKIEGLPRQSGLHAAGVILNETPLEDVLPLLENQDGLYTAQYEMNPLAEQGFLKMDILGLRNLTILDNAIKRVNQNHHLDLKEETLPYDEKEIFSLIAQGKTMGLFQLESSGIKRAIDLIEPTSFDDIVAVLALFRPGPMNNIPLYAKRKKGQEPVTYFTDSLKDILAPTYGIIVYQEQVLQVVKEIAGFSLQEADLFRRAISKKDAKKLEVMKVDFLKGALKNGYSEQLALQIYDHIFRFADYGFKKAHAVAYACLTCKMGYIKVHYPAEFYASILEGNASNNDAKFLDTISEIKSLSIPILLPSILSSTQHFEVENHALRLPLSIIKGISSLFVLEILKEREIHPFTSFFDFVIRMSNHKMTLSQLEALIHAGAFDEFSYSRSSLLNIMKSALEFASLVNFSYDPNEENHFLLPPPIIINMEDDPLYRCEKEIETLGFMLSHTPLYFYQEKRKEENLYSIQEINQRPRGRFVAILKSIKTIKTKKGSPMAFLLFFDDENEKEVIVFPETYAKCYQILERNQLYVIDGYEGKDHSFISNAIEKWRI